MRKNEVVAYCPAYAGTWFLPTQDCLSRCPCFEVWLDALSYTFPLCVWYQLFCRSCPILSKGWIPFNTPQRSEGYHILSEVCHDVEVEPHLQPLSDERFQQKTANTQDGARLDIAMNGFWGGRYEKCFTDVRVFNPLAPSNSGTTLQSCYRKHEITKKRAYELRIREVEHSSFTL